MAGPKPFHSALTPSWAIVLRTQSSMPEYVPVGADWILDFITYRDCSVSLFKKRNNTIGEAYIRRNGQSPHGHTRSSSSEDNCTQVKFRWRSSSRCQSLLRHFVSSEITIGRVANSDFGVSIKFHVTREGIRTLHFPDHREQVWHLCHGKCSSHRLLGINALAHLQHPCTWLLNRPVLGSSAKSKPIRERPTTE